MAEKQLETAARLRAKALAVLTCAKRLEGYQNGLLRKLAAPLRDQVRRLLKAASVLRGEYI